MYKFTVQKWIKKKKKCARQKSYGFKILAKFGRWQKKIEITAGTCVFKKSCSTSNVGGVGALFDKMYGFFCSKLGACPLASLPSLADSSPARPSETYQVKHRISFHNKANKASKAHQANQASKASKQSTAKHTKAKQATKPRKPNKSKTSKQTKENHKPSQLKPNQGK